MPNNHTAHGWNPQQCSSSYKAIPWMSCHTHTQKRAHLCNANFNKSPQTIEYDPIRDTVTPVLPVEVLHISTFFARILPFLFTTLQTKALGHLKCGNCDFTIRFNWSYVSGSLQRHILPGLELQGGSNKSLGDEKNVTRSHFLKLWTSCHDMTWRFFTPFFWLR